MAILVLYLLDPIHLAATIILESSRQARLLRQFQCQRIIVPVALRFSRHPHDPEVVHRSVEIAHEMLLMAVHLIIVAAVTTMALHRLANQATIRTA